MGEPVLSRLLPSEAISTGVAAADWRAAVRAAGDLLVATGATTADYTSRMRQVVETHGPYIVVSPGLALAHAAPGRSVLRTGLSWVSLSSPVPFGHPGNDPVGLVVGLAGADRDDHCAALAAVTALLASPDRLAALSRIEDPDRVHSLISAFEVWA
ncbi:PTS sugar transporter subunit IIA [Actinorugispora endophytica]|uniref:PTS sugar transporter subunit IIA n=1 Tax=Actinorugispora endophytica TaxID=1605990 RepID=UPI00105C2D3F|nr:PTS sugar transporter subunit IIA [Actinorugispora endophytica]